MYSKNYELGLRIHRKLVEHGVENPRLDKQIVQWNDNDYQVGLQVKLADFIQGLGVDLNDASMAKTPGRIVKFFINELFFGLDYKNFPNVTAMPNNFAYNGLLLSKGISVYSTCEHHFVSITGQAIVAYVPDKIIVGLSKLNRIVNFFARRPQVQERMMKQIFIVLQDILQTDDVALAINATHNCIVTRGVEDADNKTLTVELGGKFLRDVELKGSFYTAAMNLT